ncbi:MAG TPA: glycosyltransferase family 4 protein [Thermoanaerobaculia bacterium]|nr:glycosyltransferase family 4 protein [Thermoanaerobaculia bacterium]
MSADPLRIDYVSPLPPTRTGIADYSRDLLPHLEPLCDLRVVRLPGQEVAAQIADRWPPVAMTALGEGGRLPLYQMGNNRHHLEVWRAAMATPGVLTLHDLVLHHFQLDRTLGHGDYPAYERQLALDHGWVGEAAARPVRFGGYGLAAQFALPAHRDLLRRQRGVLVHSAWAAERVGQEDPELWVRAVPMAMPLPPAGDPAAGRGFRERRGLPLTAPLLGSFGFQTPMKRSDRVIRALAQEPLREARLVVAGEVAEVCDLEGEARRAGVADRVRFLGYLPYADLEEAIAAVDLCLNLRYPTAGETSASLLRVLAVGCPVVVSDFAQFAELPPAVALRVAPGEGEVEALAARAGELLADPERLRQMAAAAREHVAGEHDPGRAARAIAAACAEAAERPPPGPAPPSLPAPTSLAWGRLPGEISVDGLEGWPPGGRRRLRVTLRNRGPARWLAAERGSGGIALRIGLYGDGGDLLADRPWLPLPRDLAPGEEVSLEPELRRPPGAARLVVEPHVLGGGVMHRFGGPAWEAEI